MIMMIKSCLFMIFSRISGINHQKTTVEQTNCINTIASILKDHTKNFNAIKWLSPTCTIWWPLDESTGVLRFHWRKRGRGRSQRFSDDPSTRSANLRVSNPGAWCLENVKRFLVSDISIPSVGSNLYPTARSIRAECHISPAVPSTSWPLISSLSSANANAFNLSFTYFMAIGDSLQKHEHVGFDLSFR